MPKQIFRFGIKDNNLRAATWNLTVASSTNDVYLSCREMKGAIHFSLHESGQCHMTYTKDAFGEYFKDDPLKPQTRIIEKWTHQTISEGNTSPVFCIFTPFSAVNSPIQDEKDVTWIDNCKENHATLILIFLIAKGSNFEITYKRDQDLRPIASTVLNNGDQIFLVSLQIPLPDFRSFNNMPMRFFNGKTKDDLENANLRMMVLGDYNNMRCVFDFASN